MNIQISIPKDPEFPRPDKYLRQMNLQEIGYEGQKVLAKSRVLVIGAGGIGSSTLMYLAGMGIGHIGIVDNDYGAFVLIINNIYEAT